MFKRYFDSLFRFVRGQSGKKSASELGGSKYPSRGYHLGSVASTKKEAIYGTDGRWGTMDNMVSSGQNQRRMTESMENIVDQKSIGIFKSVDVTVMHADSHPDNTSTSS
jgi:hypothetical protein